MLALSKISKDEHLQITFYSGMCESGKFSPFIHPDEALAVVSPCAGRGRRNIVTCQDESKEDDLADVGGLDLLKIKLGTKGIRLPGFIPIVPKGLFKSSLFEIDSPVVGIIFQDVLTKRLLFKCGHYRFPPGCEVNENVLANEVFRGKKVILFSTGPDILIETLWWHRHNLSLFKIISQMGFAGVTGMNFSVISGECPFGQALNIKKSICYCEELEKLGVWTIPHIYAINEHQRERWKNWLVKNPQIQTITINSQLQKKQSRGMTDVFETAKFLLTETSVNIIIHGGSSHPLISLNEKFKNRVRFAASGPLKNAMIRKDKTASAYIDAYRRKLVNSHKPGYV